MTTRCPWQTGWPRGGHGRCGCDGDKQLTAVAGEVWGPSLTVRAHEAAGSVQGHSWASTLSALSQRPHSAHQARGGFDLAATPPWSWAPAAGRLVQPYGPRVAHWRPLRGYNFYPTDWDAGLCLCRSGPRWGPDCSPGFGTIWGSLSQPPRAPLSFTLLFHNPSFRDSRLYRGPRPLTTPTVHSPDRTEGQLSLGELLDLNSRKMPFSVVPVHTHTYTHSHTQKVSSLKGAAGQRWRPWHWRAESCTGI